MNPYGYGYAEPVVPPRRKRSLSTSRTDPMIADDNFGFPNRMRRNFSTDHIPNDYMYGYGPRPLAPTGPMNNYYMSPQQQQRPASSYYPQRQPYGSSGNLQYSPMQPPGLRMANPVAFGVPNSKVPIRPHQDYLKYAQGANMPYNPYNPGFSPTLMARPTIEPFQSTAIPTSIANAIARGRDPAMYSSKEQLQSGQMNPGDYRREMSPHGFHGKSPPERPPPPRYNAGLSTENLTDYELDMNSSNMRDRRSVSPSRFSPTEQRPYNVRRSTSPLPSAINSRSPEPLSLSRSGSRTSLNHNYGSPLRMSRESSPLLGRPTSPYLSSSPFSYGSATNHSAAREYKPLTRSASTSKYTSSSRAPQLSSLSGHMGSSSISALSNAKAADYLLRTSRNSVLTKDRQLNLDPVSSSVDDPNFARPMDTLQVPNGHDASSQNANQNGNQPMNAAPRQMDRQFSESFTDHCDQYKSLTSKILAKKGNRRSGDFSDINLASDELENSSRKSSFSPSYSPDMCDYEMAGENNDPSQFRNDVIESPIDPFDTLLQSPSPQPSLRHDDAFGETRGQSPPKKPADNNLLKQLAAPGMRRSSSSNGLAGQQRKGSLPSDYISNANSIALSSEWSREKVADMAHQARQRLQHPSNSTATTFKKIGTWFTRQFVFLLIAGLNILLAYVFYNLLAMLPVDETARK